MVRRLWLRVLLAAVIWSFFMMVASLLGFLELG
jgi:hypothetical protein